MKTITAHDAKEQFVSLVKTVLQENSKYLISLPEGNAVLLSEKNYEDLLITLEMLSTPLLMPDDDRGDCFDHGNCCR